MNEAGYRAQVQERLVQQGFTVEAAPPDLSLGLTTLVREETWGRLLLALVAAPTAAAIGGDRAGGEQLVRACAAWMRNMQRQAERPCYLVLVFPFDRRVPEATSAAIRALQQEDPYSEWGVLPWVADLDVGLVDRHNGFPRVDDRVTAVLTDSVPHGRVEEVLRQARAPQVGRRQRSQLESMLGDVPATRLILAATVAFYLWVFLVSGESFNNIVGGPRGQTLLAWGANYGPLVVRGQAWRLATHMLLHGGLLHLVLNMYSLWIIGRNVEVIYGSGRLSFIYVVAGVAGGIGSAIVRPYPALSVGASGAIFGLMGALVYFALTLKGRVDWRAMLSPLALNLFLG
ncbi:MAG TPA: rhomboid family intramembrane serine protease, partial [Symbiobacteriaceae bacterium]|nr:rhomboid family intramembrane serine protease [Symbiobacteriaceae bacterium]